MIYRVEVKTCDSVLQYMSDDIALKCYHIQYAEDLSKEKAASIIAARGVEFIRVESVERLDVIDAGPFESGSTTPTSRPESGHETSYHYDDTGYMTLVGLQALLMDDNYGAWGIEDMKQEAVDCGPVTMTQDIIEAVAGLYQLVRQQALEAVARRHGMSREDGEE